MTEAVPPLHGYLPQQPSQTYANVRHCIYCGKVDGLSDEHIIPLELGGRLVLPESSCATCRVKTGKFEQTCLRTMYGPLRLLYDLPSRRKRERPESMALKVKRTEVSDWEYVPVPQDRYPFLITFPYFEAQGALTGEQESTASGPSTDRFWIRGASPHHDFFDLLESLASELRVHSLMPESKADVPAFCSMLAKVALCYVAAEAELSVLGSPLARIAIGEDLDNCMHYIGSVTSDEPPSNSLHELTHGRHERTGAYIVRIRLLAKLGTPTYFVVIPSTNHGLQRTRKTAGG